VPAKGFQNRVAQIKQTFHISLLSYRLTKHYTWKRERSGKDVDSRIIQVAGWRKMEAAAQH